MLHKFGKERVRDVGNDEAQHATAARDERAGVRVGIEIQLFDGFVDAFGRAGADFV
ncbi:MAG: hypothetical protein NVS9B14_09060 [Candidatus Acidiferrum sp.]